MSRLARLDNAAAHELRLIENVHREDLSDSEKGDAVLQLWACDKYETLKEVCESIQVEYNTAKAHWLPASRKLSNKVRNLIRKGIPRDTFTDRHEYKQEEMARETALLSGAIKQTSKRNPRKHTTDKEKLENLYKKVENSAFTGKISTSYLKLKAEELGLKILYSILVSQLHPR